MTESVLVHQSIDGLPPAPAFAAVARFVYQPGAVFGPAAGTGPVCMHIESGSMVFSAKGPLLHTSGSQPPTVMPPDVEFLVVAGDQLVVPGNVTHSARTQGQLPASMVGVAIFPDAPALQFPPGISFQALALGQAAILPDEPVRVDLVRRTVTDEPLRRIAGFTLLHVESGSVSVTVDGPGVAITRAPAADAPPGPPGPPEPVPPGGQVLLAAGDSGMVPTGVGIALRASGAPAVLLQATAVPDPAGRQAVVRRFYYDAWNSGRPGLVDQLFAQDFVNHVLLPGQLDGRAGVRQLLDGLSTAFPDGSVSIDLQFAQADRVVTRHTFRGTHRGTFLGVAPTQRPVTVTGIDLHLVDGGTIRQAWGYLDLVGLAGQLGVLP